MSAAPDAVLAVPHFLYRCFDADGQLLYVGVARNVEDRLFHHTHFCNRGKQPNGSLRRHMVSHAAESYPTKVEARAAERRAITTEAPLLNRQHNPHRFRKVSPSTYGFVAPIHPISAAAFPGLPQLDTQERAA